MCYKIYCLVSVIGKPTHLTVENSSTQDTINLTWNDPEEGGNAMEVELYVVTVTPGDNSLETKGNKIEISNLDSNTNYLLSVAAQGTDSRNGTRATVNGITGI